MKLGSLFNVLQGNTDLLELFEGVETHDQMVTRLERLKRQAPEELLLCVQGLRVDLRALFDDTLEMGASLDDEDTSELDAELEKLSGPDENEPEKKPEPEQNPPADSASGQ